MNTWNVKCYTCGITYTQSGEMPSCCGACGSLALTVTSAILDPDTPEEKWVRRFSAEMENQGLWPEEQ